MVADSLWGSTPMIAKPICHSPLRSNRYGTARRALLLRAGHSHLEPRLVTAPDGLQTDRRATPQTRVGSPLESVPPGTWTESGQTPALAASL